MKLHKLAATAILGLGLTMPLMAGDAISEALVKKAEKNVKAITPAELFKMVDEGEVSFIALDVREADMRMEGTFDAEENVEIARGVLEFDVGAKIEDKKALVIVYCRVGKSAVLAADTMQRQLGYSNVRYLKGGLDAWMEQGYSIYNHFGEVKLAK
ncbi:MAG: rhodanese-like domain-containing protein [Sulfurimonadaceae bacterium]|jgi:rhodanese-related sulfurtransferase